MIEEVTITADRRYSNYRQTMATRDLYLENNLRNSDVDHISELLNQGAGINFHRGNGVEYLGAIRSPVFTGGAGAGSFLYLEDGIATRSAGFANVNGLSESFFEVAKLIEVVKGPGSALYGSNAVHGIVSVASPDIDANNSLRLSGGSHGFSQLQYSKNVITGNAGFRADIFSARDDGWRSTSGFNQQKIKLQRIHESELRVDRTVLDFYHLDQETAGFVEGEDAYRIAELAMSNDEPEAFRKWYSFRLHHRIELSLTDDKSYIITPYLRSNKMDFRLHFLPGEALEKNGHDSVGIQVSRYQTIGNHEWIVGSDLEITDGYLSVFQDNPDAGFGAVYPSGLHYDYDVITKTTSLFVQDRITLTDSTELALGLRAEYINYDYKNNADNAIDGRIKRVADRNDDFFYLMPKFSLSKKMLHGVTTIKVSRGQRAPQTSDLYRLQINQVAGDAKVETLDSLELQYKIVSQSWEVSTNLYTMRKDNFFFRDADGFNESNGKTSHRGVEIKLGIDITKFFKFSLDASYAKHQYEFDRAISSSSNPTESINKGDAVDSAPRKLANFRVDYTDSFWSHGLELRYVGNYFIDAANENSYPGHSILVYRGSYKLNHKIKFFWRLNNVSNARYAERADFAFGNERYFPGERIAGFAGVNINF